MDREEEEGCIIVGPLVFIRVEGLENLEVDIGLKVSDDEMPCDFVESGKVIF